ncbi:MAG: VCBS repeat-containing protein [Elusimicrobiota bacterium]
MNRKTFNAIMIVACALGLLGAAASSSPGFGASAAAAKAAETTLKGYVVKVEGAKVYIDLGLSSGAARGQRFEVYREGEELRHPVTGDSLGPVIETVVSGSLLEVRETYSVGRIENAPGEAAPGLRARIDLLDAPPSEVPAAADAAPERPGKSGLRSSDARSPFVAMEAVDIAVGDVDADGEPEIMLADQRSVRVFSFWGSENTWKPLGTFEENTTGVRLVSLEAADLDQDGRAEIFATAHNKLFQNVESFVLDWADGSLKKRTTLPWMVRSYQTAGPERALAVQRLEADRSFPTSRVYGLEYVDGKYRRSKRSLKHKRLEWVYGFGLAPREDGALLLSYNHVNRIRIRFPKGSWTSPETYGQTAERLEWQGKTLHFHPGLYVESGGPEGLSGVYTLRNVARFFGLASSFGMFSRSELHHLRWNGLSLEPDWKAELGGYASGLAEVPGAPGHPESLLVSVVGADGRTSVWRFRK